MTEQNETPQIEKNKRCVIVIPIYNAEPTVTERFSIQSLAKAEGIEKYPIVFVTKKSFTDKEIQKYLYLVWDNCNVQSISCYPFPDECFESTETYSILMKSKGFYEKFAEYEYMMVFQTDCYCFSLKGLDEWLDEGFDFVGAPIIANRKDWPTLPLSGNGGLSLRKVSSFIRYTADQERIDVIDEANEAYRKYEDVFFLVGLSQVEYIDTPTWEDAAMFSWDMNPDVLYDKFEALPQIGCHAWPKNALFWRDHIDMPVEVYNAAYDANKEFLELYYSNSSSLSAERSQSI